MHWAGVHLFRVEQQAPSTPRTMGALLEECSQDMTRKAKCTTLAHCNAIHLNSWFMYGANCETIDSRRGEAIFKPLNVSEVFMGTVEPR